MVLGSALRESERPIPPASDRVAGEAKAAPLVAIVVASDEVRGALIEAVQAMKARAVMYKDLRTLRQRLLRDEVYLVITDATLPDANWADVLRFIVRASLATDVLVHSRTADERLRSEVMGRGASGLVTPPYSVESLGGGALPWEEERHDIAS